MKKFYRIKEIDERSHAYEKMALRYFHIVIQR